MTFWQVFAMDGLATTKSGYEEHVDSTGASVSWFPREKAGS